MAASLPVLTLHALDDRDSPISVSPGVFQRGLAKLAEAGHRTIKLTEAAACVRGARPFPDKSFVITFDDGYESVFAEALPALKQHGMTATVFLTVGEGESSGRLPEMEDRVRLTWDQIREMSEAGVDFGAHTMNHPDLTCLSPEKAEAEVATPKRIIEDVLGMPADSFAYPFGYHDDRTCDIVKRHFACACSTKLGLISGRSDVYALERVDAHYLRTDRLFGLMTSGFLPSYLRLRNLPRRIKQTIRRRPR